MRKNQKRLLIILLILLVLLVLLVVIVNKISNMNKARLDYGYEVMGVKKDPEIEKKLDKSIAYKNISVLQELDGELPVSTVTNKIKQTFLTYIPDTIDDTRNMTKEELISYFDNNKIEIRKNLKIDNEDSFLNMIENFRQLNSDLKTEYESCSFSRDENIKLEFSYTNGETIECEVIGTNANTIMFQF